MTTAIPVIIDTDPGVDDILAILLALASPEVDVKAITIVFGNTDMQNAYLNVLKLMKALEDHFAANATEISRFPIIFAEASRHPVLAKGSNVPLGGEPIYAQYFHGRDGLSDISTRHPELSTSPDWKPSCLCLSNADAVDLSLEIIRSIPSRSLTYIALGPLTNLACIMRKDSQCVRDRIGRVIVMGGALEAPGNVTATAEFNFYADPFAVQELLHPKDLSMGLPLDRFILIPLDITTNHTLSFKDYKQHVDPSFVDTSSPSKQLEKTPLVHFTSSFLERTVELMRGVGADAIELHDPTAIWCALCNPPCLGSDKFGPNVAAGWKVKKQVFQVEKFGEHTRGMLVTDRRRYEGNKAGANRAVEYDSAAIHKTDAPVQVESHKQREATVDGVPVLTETPGAAELVKFVLKRIWGVSLISDTK